MSEKISLDSSGLIIYIPIFAGVLFCTLVQEEDEKGIG